MNRSKKNNQICYCFGYTDADIEADVVAHNGESTILEKIKSAKLKGTCRCHLTHPLGK